jgi:hypothetical protein
VNDEIAAEITDDVTQRRQSFPAFGRGRPDVGVEDDRPRPAAQLWIHLVHLARKREVRVRAELLLERLGFRVAVGPGLILHYVEVRSAGRILSDEIDLRRIEQ